MTTPTYNLTAPSWEVPGDYTMNIREVKFGDGYTQRMPSGLQNMDESWNLKWDNLSPDEALAITAFFEGLQGAYPFFWTPPNSTPRKFVCKKWTRTPVDVPAQRLSASFTRVYDPGP